MVGLDASKSVGNAGWDAEIVFSKKLVDALIDAGHKVHLYVMPMPGIAIGCLLAEGGGAIRARLRLCVGRL